MERGKARYTIVSGGSNTTIKDGSGTLYRVFQSLDLSGSSNAVVRIEGSTDLGAAPDLNTPGTGTIYVGSGADLDFWPGVGFDALSIAATSNARLTVIWE